MVNFMYCSHDSSRLWDPASFNFGDANALEIDASNDDEEYVLHPGPRPQHVSHQLIAPHTEGKSPRSNFVFIAEAQDTKRESLIRYTLDPGFIGPLRDDHGFSDRLKLPTAETLSESEPSAQSVHQEDKYLPLDQLDSPTVTVHTGFTQAEVTPAQTEFPSLSGPDDKEWDSKKEAIGMYYMKQKLPLTKVLGMMKTNHGFSATKPMYKTRFRKWGWKKYKSRQKKEKQAPTFSVEMPANFTAAGKIFQNYPVSLGDSLTNAPSWGVFENQAMPVAAPLRLALVTEDSVFVKGIVDILRSHVRMVFYSEEDIQRRWEVTDPFEVEEDECDDLFVKVVNFSHQSLSYPSATWESGVHRISLALDPVIQGCGLFALPTIWTCTFRLLKEGHPQAAFEFLLQARRLAVSHGWAEPFQRILELLTELLDATELFASPFVDTTPLQNGLKEAYLCCLEQANSSLRSSKLTLLSLRSFFINYVDKSCTSEQQRSLDEAKDLVEESKLMNGVNSQTTLNIMGQRLFILQSLSEPPPELEMVANEIDAQIMLLSRRQGPLDDSLLDIWKDAKHVLADYYSRKNDSTKAISLLQGYMAQCSLGGYGDFDEIAKKKLDDLLKQTPVVMEQAQHTVYCNQRDCFCLYRTVDWGSFPL